MFEKLGRALGLSQKSYIYGIFGNLGTRMISWPTRSFKSLAEEGYKTNPTVFACINEIAVAVAGVKWYVATVDKKGKETRIEGEHPLKKLVNDPNPEQSWGDLQSWNISDYLLSGNSLELIIGPRGPFEDLAQPLTGIPIALWQIQPGSLEAVPTTTGQLGYWRLRQAGMLGTLWGKQTDIHPSRIIHRKSYNPLDRFFGLSPLEAAARDVDTLNVGMTFNYNLLANAGRPEGLLLVKNSMDPVKKKEAQAQVDTSFNDPAQNGRVKLVDGAEGIEYKSIATTPRDMEFKEQRLMSAVSICNVFNVPPELVGVQGQKTYSNYKEARMAFYLECILPHLDRIQEHYQKRLVKSFGPNIVLRYDKDDIEAIQEDRDAKASRARADYQAGLLTANEARHATGEQPVDDALGDVRMLPLSQVPVDEVIAGGEDTTEEDALAEDEAAAADAAKKKAEEDAKAGK